MRKGRELELLIERIKKLQLPEAVIQSPEWVIDRDTGTPREVDVGIRHKVGDSEVFIAIECRDKKDVQDIQWIEQLIAKKESVGAHALFAVTGSDFTKPAIIKAQKRGVFLRRMIKKIPEDIAGISNSIFVTFQYLEPKHIALSLTVPNSLRDSLEDCNYQYESIGEYLSYSDLFALLVNSNVYRDVAGYICKNMNGEEGFFKYNEFEAKLIIPKIEVITPNGRFPVYEARVRSELNYGEVSLPLIALSEYSPVVESENNDHDRATMFTYGLKQSPLGKIILDNKSNEISLEIFTKELLSEGKVFIGMTFVANEPIRPVWIRLDL